MDIKIRSDLRVGDIGYITYLHGILYAREYNYDHTFEAYVAEPLSQFARRSNPRERIWIVENNSEVLGSIAICESSATEAQLRWFLLSPSLRGEGIGKKLIDLALEFSRSQHYESVSLWTVKGLEAAKALYLSFGFSLEQDIEHEVWGALHTEQKYTKSLSPAHNKAIEIA
ncbi:MAG: GNAT family N-acetyltransferase [Halioglobus sp.]